MLPTTPVGHNGARLGAIGELDAVDTEQRQCALRIHAPALELTHALCIDGAHRRTLARCEGRRVFKERTCADANVRRQNPVPGLEKCPCVHGLIADSGNSVRNA
jgi:hypothetical protein